MLTPALVPIVGRLRNHHSLVHEVGARLTRLRDLSVETWTIVVAHPKGEGSWAASAPARILNPARGTGKEFLAQRSRYLAEAGVGKRDLRMAVAKYCEWAR